MNILDNNDIYKDYYVDKKYIGKYGVYFDTYSSSEIIGIFNNEDEAEKFSDEENETCEFDENCYHKEIKYSDTTQYAKEEEKKEALKKQEEKKAKAYKNLSKAKQEVKQIQNNLPSYEKEKQIKKISRKYNIDYKDLISESITYFNY